MQRSPELAVVDDDPPGVGTGAPVEAGGAHRELRQAIDAGVADDGHRRPEAIARGGTAQGVDDGAGLAAVHDYLALLGAEPGIAERGPHREIVEAVAIDVAGEDTAAPKRSPAAVPLAAKRSDPSAPENTCTRP